MQHGHEVRLPRTETAVQVAGFAVAGIDGAVDEPEGVVEAADELRSDHVLFERFFGLRDPLGQVEDKIALADAFREVKDFGDKFVRHGRRSTKNTEVQDSDGGSGEARRSTRGSDVHEKHENHERRRF